MNFKIEKNLRIVNELMACCYRLGSTDINVHIKNESTETIIKIFAHLDEISDSTIKKLNDILNTQRQHEIEQYYWNLGGESEFDDQLSLVGMMIDYASVTYTNSILQMNLIRKEKEAL